MQTTNLLENWHKEALDMSSPFTINPIISRDNVSFIYKKFLAYFGLEFFDVKQNPDKPLEKISWLYSLFANKKHLGCINALYDLAVLIDYTKNLDSAILKDLHDKKNSPRDLRDIFFEIYIFYILDRNSVQNQKKITVNNQVVEGTCIILEQEYLFECRKLYMPRLSDLDAVKRLMLDFIKHAGSLKRHLGMICTIEFKRPLKKGYYASFEKKLKITLLL